VTPFDFDSSISVDYGAWSDLLDRIEQSTQIVPVPYDRVKTGLVIAVCVCVLLALLGR
jgi:hypothetical protein